MSENVIITGAAGNLGESAVKKFLHEGYHVIATVSPGKNLGYKTSGSIEVHEVDLTNEKMVDNFIQQTIRTHKTIDVALLLVGGFSMGSIDETNTAAIQKMIDLNFYTAYHTARPLFKQMLTQATGGRIILIGSRPALNSAAGKGSIAYAFSKSLVIRLAEILNAEGAKKNVVTHVIAPSIMDTPANREAMPNANPTDWVKTEEVADAMHYLASEKGKSIREGITKMYGNS